MFSHQIIMFHFNSYHPS